MKIFGEEIAVKAQIRSIEGFSSHADRNDLMNWVGEFSHTLKEIFVVHGEEDVAVDFAQTLSDKYGIKTVVPDRGESFQITLDEVKEEHIPVKPEKKTEPAAADKSSDIAAFYRLMEEFNREVIQTENPDQKRIIELETEIMKKMLDIIKGRLVS